MDKWKDFFSNMGEDNRDLMRGNDEAGVRVTSLGRASFFESSEACLNRLRKSREQHDTDRITYRCFLPDLTGFATVCHVRSTPSSEPVRASAGEGFSKRTFDPHKRISGCRAPLAPI